MSFSLIGHLPTPEELHEKFPLSPSLLAKKQARDAELRRIFRGEDDRLILIVGPCSADREDAVLEYVTRLADLQEQTRDAIFLIPRIYTRKPRTGGYGYQGIAHQPDPQKDPDPLNGLSAMRRLHLRVLEASGLSSADELLYPYDWAYVGDLLSYVSIGARSVEDPQHRLTASGLDIPVGMKNPTNGDVSAMLHAIDAARNPQTCILGDAAYATGGNPFAHAILRGTSDASGATIPNYKKEDLENVLELSEKSGMEKPMILVDTNHANSGKQYALQPQIAMEVIRMRKSDPHLAQVIRGLMIESYLKEGCQPIGDTPLVYGQSITDPCLGWAETRSLITTIAETL